MSNSKKQLKQTPGANAPGNGHEQSQFQQTPQPPSDGEDHEQITFPKRANAGNKNRAGDPGARLRAMNIIDYDPPL